MSDRLGPALAAAQNRTIAELQTERDRLRAAIREHRDLIRKGEDALDVVDARLWEALDE